MKLTFDNIRNLFGFNTFGKSCAEIEFRVKGMNSYQLCWMGKMPNRDNPQKDCYWFGLVPDGSQAYDYDNFEEFASAPVFEDKSLKDICHKIELLTVNGCAPETEILNAMGLYV